MPLRPVWHVLLLVGSKYQTCTLIAYPLHYARVEYFVRCYCCCCAIGVVEHHHWRGSGEKQRCGCPSIMGKREGSIVP
ncbi:hypothetical protein BZA05DRAFT_410982 [Tricharina praecox]|uniref:uncharacterized protein n=1 Tax=Tricharina praecox TaxID=43433 RepID=UPI0022201D69|nr:uncharacterized protein BZA05DRAFT_410982 [Tricharina praecox]KAI5843240.1 hypothetical protein BZA05DRAFT_410982 [Tricharina praecox]